MFQSEEPPENTQEQEAPDAQKDKEIEAVFIATDAPSHARLCIAGLKRGLHMASAVPAVFGEDQPSRLANDVERRIAKSSDDWEEVFTRYKDELSLELLGEIRARLSRRGSK